MMTKLAKAWCMATLLLLSACNKETNTADSHNAESTSKTGEVMATVNGEPITQADIDFMINRTFSGSEQLFFDDAMQAKVLDSLIASKAMQQKMLTTLSRDELKDIDNRARAYQEELYLKAYLQQFATPEPVSSKMVQEYYEQYPEEFGGGELRVFEMLSTNTKPSETQRDAILSAVDDIKASTDWRTFASSGNLGLNYKRATMAPNLFDASIERAVRLLGTGESSDAVFIKGVPHIFRVLEIQDLPTRPLSEVSAAIRKKLAAMQLKKAVKAASDEAISQADVRRY